MIFVATVRVPVAGEVEPMPSPALSVVRRSQQVVDHLLPGIGGLISQEGFDLSWRGRQSDQVKVGAADEITPFCARYGGNGFALTVS